MVIVVQLFGDYGVHGEKKIVDDPYYGGGKGFEECYAQCVRFSEGFLKSVLGVDVGK